jgi:type IV pilus assembly protein PilP
MILSSEANQSKVKKFLKEKTKLQNPFELRDPFKAPYMKGKAKEKSKYEGVLRDGVYTNEPRVTSSTSLNDLKVAGILVGKNRRAIVETGGRKIVVKEGDVIGSDNAEIKAILPGGMVVVEKIVNVYGQDEFLETVIPLSK